MLELVNLFDDLVLVYGLVRVNVVHCVDLHDWYVRDKFRLLLLLGLYVACQDDWIVALGRDDTT